MNLLWHFKKIISFNKISLAEIFQRKTNKTKYPISLNFVKNATYSTCRNN